jgi:hypothetical protein
MMRHLYPILTITLSFLGSAAAQLKTIEIKTDTATNGGLHVRVMNLNSIPLEAFQATYRCSSGGEQVIFDALFNRHHDLPIPPSGSYAFDTSPHFVSCKGGIEAVLFADGSSEGDTDKVQEIFLRREALARGFSLVQTIVKNADTAGLTNDQLKEKLSSEKDGLTGESSRKNMDERLGLAKAFEIAEANLHGPTGTDYSVNMQSLPLSTAPADVDHKRRMIILKFIGGWSDDIHKASSEANRPAF